MNKIPLCLSADNNYAQHLGATISSILRSKDAEDFIEFYIIDGGISLANKEKLNSFVRKNSCAISYVLPDLEKLKNCKVFRGDYQSLAMYYRLLIPELILGEDKVIYLDCDIIVRYSLKGLFDTPLKGYSVAAVEDLSAEAHALRLNLDKYVNSGVLLMDLKKMREEGAVAKIFDWVDENQSKIECHDQDIINAAMQSKILLLDSIYNAQVHRKNRTYFDKIKDPTILHFISPKKPWTLWKPFDSTRWAKEYFKALEGTPWSGFVAKFKIKSWLIAPFRVFYPTDFFKPLVENVFSIKNTPDRKNKVLHLLGIQFKFKRKKIKKQ